MNDKGEVILGAIAVIMIIGVLVTLIPSCDGGTIVRGLFWLECLKG